MTLSDRLQEILAAENLTPYRAGEIIEPQTQEPRTTIGQRLTRWCKQTPKTWEDLEQTLAALGYEIRIEKSSGSRAT